MDFKDDEIKRLQLAAEAEEKKRFLQNARIINESLREMGEEPVTPTDEAPTPQENTSSSLRQIRTFQGDVAEALNEQQESLVSIQKREAEKREAIAPTKPQSESKSALVLIIGIIVFIILGVGGGYFAYTKFTKEPAPIVVSRPENQFLSVKAEKNIDALNLSRENFLEILKTEINSQTSGDNNGVVQLQLRKGEGEGAPLLSTSEFLILLDAQAPPAMVRALDKLFMFGLVSRDTVKPFLLIKLDSFEQTFPGMLEWEKNMREDLAPLFVSQDRLASIPVEKEFEDLTISNKDTRILRDNDGKGVLIYTYIDNQMLLITENEDSLKSVLSLISASKLSR